MHNLCNQEITAKLLVFRVFSATARSAGPLSETTGRDIIATKCGTEAVSALLPTGQRPPATMPPAGNSGGVDRCGRPCGEPVTAAAHQVAQEADTRDLAHQRQHRLVLGGLSLVGLAPPAVARGVVEVLARDEAHHVVVRVHHKQVTHVEVDKHLAGGGGTQG